MNSSINFSHASDTDSLYQSVFAIEHYLNIEKVLIIGTDSFARIINFETDRALFDRSQRLLRDHLFNICYVFCSPRRQWPARLAVCPDYNRLSIIGDGIISDILKRRFSMDLKRLALDLLRFFPKYLGRD